jgi:hypothetical protein
MDLTRKLVAQLLVIAGVALLTAGMVAELVSGTVAIASAGASLIVAGLFTIDVDSRS